jgi:hypothetical protein
MNKDKSIKEEQEELALEMLEECERFLEIVFSNAHNL